VVSGRDPRNGKPYVNQLFLGHTAGAGAPHQDAWLTMLHVGNGGMCYIDSVELDEVYTPIHVHTRRLIPDSEGAGRYRGAPAIEVEFGPVDCAMEAAFVADGNIHVPQGARGGLASQPSAQYKRTANKELVALDQCSMVTIGDGETLVSIAQGGGGYGDPKTRDLQLVQKDVAEGLVSAERAKEVYGVVITAGGEINKSATRKLRGG
jgi:N-methylhydantoinase B